MREVNLSFSVAVEEELEDVWVPVVVELIFLLIIFRALCGQISKPTLQKPPECTAQNHAYVPSNVYFYLFESKWHHIDIICVDAHDVMSF